MPVFFKSDLDIPEQISRYFSIYLMMAIGFKAGTSIAATPEINSQVISVILAGIVTGFTQPFIGFILLRFTTKLDSSTAAAISAHYGSISMVTFVTAVSFLQVNWNCTTTIDSNILSNKTEGLSLPLSFQ